MHNKNLYVCGRLWDYKYYYMDQAIKRALDIAKIILKKDL
jgi:UDP-galactopyranose mutase